jgi:hypothetical protein
MIQGSLTAALFCCWMLLGAVLAGENLHVPDAPEEDYAVDPGVHISDPLEDSHEADPLCFQVVEIYSEYINNFSRAMELVRLEAKIGGFS